MNSNSDFVCDVCVVGKGLLGSAAARHLTEMGLNVLLLGPDEPPVRSEHSGVFGSHYDSGRITRIIDTDLYCARIAEASITRYRDLEESSGVDFFEDVGHLAVSPMKSYISEVTNTAQQLGVDFKSLTHDELPDAFPYFSFTDEVSGVYEHSTGGYVNPRNLIKAQIEMVLNAKSEILAEPVSVIEKCGDFFEVFTESGRKVRANEVLVASGVFSERLIHGEQKLDLEICESTVVLAELREEDVVQLEKMPSVIFRHESEVEKGVYLLPPIRYPDRKTYIKIGHSESRPMSDPATNLVKWFQGDGDQLIADWLRSQLFDLLPNTSFANIKTESCAVSRSSTGRQFIDVIDESGIHVLLAGNGYSAKSSDELGRIAAHKIISGEVPDEYSDIDFKVKYKGHGS
ncbi:MAG: FAD-binding oxidoreductase [Acidimicrobiales bacterium]|nr:FAD-binding oxidoreductase [Acidimicrobiales bacterium]